MWNEITNEKAIERIKAALDMDDIEGHCYILTKDVDRKAFHLAIKALEDIEKIKAIIRTPKNFLEQDVYRYKMICEVIANECKTESKEAEERA